MLECAAGCYVGAHPWPKLRYKAPGEACWPFRRLDILYANAERHDESPLKLEYFDDTLRARSFLCLSLAKQKNAEESREAGDAPKRQAAAIFLTC